MVTVIVFVLGLIVGSFLNVMIFRLHSGKSFLFGRSACPDCGKELQTLDLIPILSFAMLKGRCRYCKSSLSWQYPIVELITAIVFVLLFASHGSRIMDHGLWIQLVIACVLIVIAVYDFKHYLILDKVILPASVLAFLYQLFYGNLLWALIGAAIISGFFVLQYFASRGKWIGFGDVKLGILLGLIFAKNSLWFLVFGYFLGALIGLLLIVTAKKTLQSRVPFGTILGLSAIIFMLYGDLFVKWYINLLGL